MQNFFFGMLTMSLVTVLLELVDKSVPNSLIYWIDIWLPFV